jgi:hypothetical protein
VIVGKGGGSLKTGRFFAGTGGNQGDLLTTLLPARHSDRSPRWDRDEANRGTQGIGNNHGTPRLMRGVLSLLMSEIKGVAAYNQFGQETACHLTISVGVS